jgi:hypothetical protein
MAAGRAMAQEVSRWPLTSEARVHAWVNPCGICRGQSSTGTGIPPSLRFASANIIPPCLSTLIYHVGYEQ